MGNGKRARVQWVTRLSKGASISPWLAQEEQLGMKKWAWELAAQARAARKPMCPQRAVAIVRLGQEADGEREVIPQAGAPRGAVALPQQGEPG